MVKVTEIRLNKTKSELKVSFDDQFSSVLSSELLRVESPSAEVQGHTPNQKKTPSGKSRYTDVAFIPTIDDRSD